MFGIDKVSRQEKKIMRGEKLSRAKIPSKETKQISPAPPPGMPSIRIASGWKQAGMIARKLHSGLLYGKNGISSELDIDLDFQILSKTEKDKISQLKKNPPESKTKEEVEIEKELEKNEAAKKEYSKLSNKQKEMFIKLASILWIRGGLIRLLGQRKLLLRDSKGNTILDNIYKIGTQELPEEIEGDRITIIKELLSSILEPGMIKQGNRGTCTVTTLQHMHATKEPAEYARIVLFLRCFILF